MEESLVYIDEFFPNIAQSHDGLQNPLRFAMQCQHFVEMIKMGDTAGALEYAEQVLAPISTQHPDYDTQLQVHDLPYFMHACVYILIYLYLYIFIYGRKSLCCWLMRNHKRRHAISY